MEKRMMRDKYGRLWIVFLVMGLFGMVLMVILFFVIVSRKI